MNEARTETSPPVTIWVVSELYYPEETSTGYYMTGIAEGLAAHCHVRVLCAQPTYSARGLQAPRREVHNRVDVLRAWSTTWSNHRWPGRLVNMITLAASMFVQTLARVRRKDRVLVVTAPPILPFVTALACFLRRARCWVWVLDTYPEVLIAAGLCRPKSLLARTLDTANRYLYRFCEGVVVLGRCMESKAHARLRSRDAAKVRVIRTWADIDTVPQLPRAESEFLRELGLDQKFVVQFAGNISRVNDIETLVEAAALLQSDPRIHFLIVGRGGRRVWLQQQIEKRRLANMTLVEWLPRSEAAKLHQAADVVLIPLIRGMAGAAVPSRLYNSLAAGRPIIAATEAFSELARIVEEERAGWVVDPGDPARLATAVRESSQDRSRLERMGERARRAAEVRFSPDTIIQEWVDLLAGPGTSGHVSSSRRKP